MKRIAPAAGQESVWDYPRPPRWEACDHRIKVVFGGRTIVDSTQAKRVLETSHPPVFYLPIADVTRGVLLQTTRKTFCEWKGAARYYHVVVDDFFAENAAWGYAKPASSFDAIRDHVAFYAQLMDACYVDGERVQSQLGGFYGGWITKQIVGPFKGVPGSQGW